MNNKCTTQMIDSPSSTLSFVISFILNRDKVNYTLPMCIMMSFAISTEASTDKNKHLDFVYEK